MSVDPDSRGRPGVGFLTTGLAVFVLWNLATLAAPSPATRRRPADLRPRRRGRRGVPRAALAAPARPSQPAWSRSAAAAVALGWCRSPRPACRCWPPAASRCWPGCSPTADRGSRRPADDLGRGAGRRLGLLPAQAGRAVGAAPGARATRGRADRRPGAGRAAGRADGGAGLRQRPAPRARRPARRPRGRGRAPPAAGAVPGRGLRRRRPPPCCGCSDAEPAQAGTWGPALGVVRAAPASVAGGPQALAATPPRIRRTSAAVLRGLELGDLVLVHEDLGDLAEQGEVVVARAGDADHELAPACRSSRARRGSGRTRSPSAGSPTWPRWCRAGSPARCPCGWTPTPRARASSRRTTARRRRRRPAARRPR